MPSCTSEILSIGKVWPCTTLSSSEFFVSIVKPFYLFELININFIYHTNDYLFILLVYANIYMYVYIVFNILLMLYASAVKVAEWTSP